MGCEYEPAAFAIQSSWRRHRCRMQRKCIACSFSHAAQEVDLEVEMRRLCDMTKRMVPKCISPRVPLPAMCHRGPLPPEVTSSISWMHMQTTARSAACILSSALLLQKSVIQTQHCTLLIREGPPCEGHLGHLDIFDDRLKAQCIRWIARGHAVTVSFHTRGAVLGRATLSLFRCKSSKSVAYVHTFSSSRHENGNGMRMLQSLSSICDMAVGMFVNNRFWGKRFHQGPVANQICSQVICMEGRKAQLYPGTTPMVYFYR